MREYAFHLLYKQHGGSGVDLDYESIMDMEFGDIEWWVDRLNEKRKQEAAALSKSSTN